MSLEGYTGPTSGRITIGGGDNPEIKRESFTQAQDPLLTRDERNATEWFRALPPNEQYREVRRLKWNADHWSKEAKGWMEIAHRQSDEIDQLKAKIATFTPDGFTFPPAAQDLLDHATAHGWKTGRSWHVDEQDPTLASLRIVLGHEGWMFDHLRWVCDREGRGRMVGRGLVREPRRDWHDAPSLKKIKIIITEEGS